MLLLMPELGCAQEDRDNSAAASDAAAPKAAPAAAGAEKEDAALPAGEADKEDAALPAAEPEREDAAPPAAEPEREGALCASPPSSPAHEVMSPEQAHCIV